MTYGRHRCFVVFQALSILIQEADGSYPFKANQRDRKTGASQPPAMKGISWVPPRLVFFEEAGICVLLVLFS